MNLDPEIPEPLKTGELVETAALEQVPTAEALKEWLEARGLDTSGWGKGDTKQVAAFWKEIKLCESGLEVWKKADGQVQPVRVTHVLRAKVCSPSSYDRKIFLFNTWQQFGDGRKRIRNALLSEKLSTEEMPLEDHLHEVCVRAMGEEMMQLAEVQFKVSGERPAPEFDPDYQNPITVVDEKLVNHTIEVELSKSYPGLLTMYHLYTVDIVCSGLPTTDFNTLEFKEPNNEGTRKLKYVHAWIWLEWPKIQRYLFEGSKFKERKSKGSFKDPDSLADWLSRLNVDLSCWGNGEYRSVRQLFKELENQETQLEVWNRHDGVMLLMRVVHLLQLKVKSPDPKQAGKFIFQQWGQQVSGNSRQVYRFLARKISVEHLPLDRTRFVAAAEEAVKEELTYVVEPHFQFYPDQPTDLNDMSPSEVQVCRVDFVDHRTDVEESPSFKGLCTLYHIYTAEVECEGLPMADFASLVVRETPNKDTGVLERKLVSANGWSWITWQQSLDLMHARAHEMGRQQEAAIRSSSEIAIGLSSTLEKLVAKVSEDDEDAQEAQQLIRDLRRHLGVTLRESFSGGSRQRKTSCSEVQDDGGVMRTEPTSVSERLPPSMLSTLTENTVHKEMIKSLEGLQVQCRPSRFSRDDGTKMVKI